MRIKIVAAIAGLSVFAYLLSAGEIRAEGKSSAPPEATNPREEKTVRSEEGAAGQKEEKVVQSQEKDKAGKKEEAKGQEERAGAGKEEPGSGDSPIPVFGAPTIQQSAFEGLHKEFAVSMFNGKGSWGPVGIGPGYGGRHGILGAALSYTTSIHVERPGQDRYIIPSPVKPPHYWNCGLGWYLGAGKLILNANTFASDPASVQICINPDGREVSYYAQPHGQYKVGTDLSCLKRDPGNGHLVLIEKDNTRWEFEPLEPLTGYIAYPAKMISGDGKYTVTFAWTPDPNHLCKKNLRSITGRLKNTPVASDRKANFDYEVRDGWEMIERIWWEVNQGTAEVRFDYDSLSNHPLLTGLTFPPGDIVYSFDYNSPSGAYQDLLLQKVTGPAGAEEEIDYAEKDFYTVVNIYGFVDPIFVDYVVVNNIKRRGQLFQYDYPNYFDNCTSTVTDPCGNVTKHCHWGPIENGFFVHPNLYGRLRWTEIQDAGLETTVQRADYEYTGRKLSNHPVYWGYLTDLPEMLFLETSVKTTKIYGSESAEVSVEKVYHGTDGCRWDAPALACFPYTVTQRGTDDDGSETISTYFFRKNPGNNEWILALPNTSNLRRPGAEQDYGVTAVEYNLGDPKSNGYLKPNKITKHCISPEGSHGCVTNLFEEYDAQGNLLRMKTTCGDGKERRQKFEYYPNGLLKAAYDNREGDGAIANLKYYADTGWIRKHWGLNGSETDSTEYTYDRAGRIIKVTPPQGPATVAEYSISRAADKTYLQVSTAGETTKTVFNEYLQPKEKYVNGGCATISYEHSLGLKTFESVVGSMTVGTYYKNYDCLGQPWRVEHPTGMVEEVVLKTGFETTTKQTYQASGAMREVSSYVKSNFLGKPLQSILDQGGEEIEREFEYDIYGNAVKIIEHGEGDDLVRRFFYDSLGNLRWAETPEEERVEYDISPRGIVSTVRHPGSAQTLSYEYDDLDRLTKVTNCAYNFRKITVLKYDGDELTSQYLEVPAPVKEYANAKRKLTGVLIDAPLGVNGTHTLHYYTRFDEVGNLASEEYRYKKSLVDAAWSDPYSIDYEMNYGNGKLGRLYYPPDGSLKVKYDYDERERLDRVAAENDNDSRIIVSNYDYTPAGSVRKITLGNGSEIDMGCDELNRWQQLKGPGVNWDYGYDGRGNVERIFDGGSGGLPAGHYSQVYSYDALNRLQAADFSGLGTGFAYDYDKYNNLKTKRENGSAVFEFSFVNNRIQNSGFLYDPRGNLKCMVEPGTERVLQMAYEPNTNFLTRTAVPDGVVQNHYDYNTDGRVAFSEIDSPPAPHRTIGYIYASDGKYLLRESFEDSWLHSDPPGLLTKREFMIYGATGLEAKLVIEAPQPPANLKGDACPDKIVASWDPSPSVNVVRYKVRYKKAEMAEDWQVTEIADTVVVLEPLEEGATYNICVAAVNAQGLEGLPSEVISVRTESLSPRRPVIVAGDFARALDLNRYTLRCVVYAPGGDPTTVQAKYYRNGATSGESLDLAATSGEYMHFAKEIPMGPGTDDSFELEATDLAGNKSDRYPDYTVHACAPAPGPAPAGASAALRTFGDGLGHESGVDIVFAGPLHDSVSWETGGTFTMAAYVEAGGCEVAEVVLNDAGTHHEMRDDGTQGDEVAGDGVFTYSSEVPPFSRRPGSFTLEITARGTDGSTDTWPMSSR